MRRSHTRWWRSIAPRYGDAREKAQRRLHCEETRTTERAILRGGDAQLSKRP
jgi:hypothetical protein